MDIQFFKEFECEAEMLAMLKQHPNVVRFFGFCVNDKGTKFYLVTELAPDGSLRKLLDEKSKPLEWKTKIEVALGIAIGMRHLHKQDVLHLDLAARNILRFGNEVKVADFGLAKFTKHNLELAVTSPYVMGNPAWMAPELIDPCIKTPACDVYSFGITLWEIVTRELPFADKYHSNAQIAYSVLQGERPKIPDYIPNNLKDLGNIIKECVSADPSKRPDFEQIVIRLQNLLRILEPVAPTPKKLITTISSTTSLVNADADKSPYGVWHPNSVKKEDDS